MTLSNPEKPLVKGQKVLVSHLQGDELGEIESINFNSGKVVIYFDYKECPHFGTFNINQVRPFELKLASS